ncbi:MAG: hypothetical protein ACP5D7_06975 [Limnospira sp.]
MWVKINVVLIGITLVYTIAPLAIAFMGLALAGLFGCESGGGMEVYCLEKPWLGQLLTTMGMMNWFALFTLPSGAIIAIILSVALGVQLILPKFIR